MWSDLALNWKTTLAGTVMIVNTVAHAFDASIAGPDLATGLAAGIGLIVAHDANVSDKLRRLVKGDHHV